MKTIISSIYIIIAGLIWGVPLQYIKYLEKKKPKNDKDDKRIIWLSNYLSACHHLPFLIFILVWALAIYSPIKWIYSLFSTPLPYFDLLNGVVIAIPASSLLILYLMINWPKNSLEKKDQDCNCALGGQTQKIVMKLTCLPNIKNDDIKKKVLLPSIPYENVREDHYSDEFSTAIQQMNQETFWKNAITGYMDGKKVPPENNEEDVLSGLPRLFLVCNYTPLQIVENAFSSALNENALNHDKVIHILRNLAGFKNYQSVGDAINGSWKNSIETIETTAAAVKEAYPHFKRVCSIYSNLDTVLTEMTMDEKWRPFFDIYKKIAITRILLWKTENGILWPGKKEADPKSKKAAFEVFRIVNEINDGNKIQVPCYVALTDKILEKLNPDKTIFKNRFPFTDYAIIIKDNATRKTEIWDFYCDSQILLTYGRDGFSDANCKRGDYTTSYELFMYNWQKNIISFDSDQKKYSLLKNNALYVPMDEIHSSNKKFPEDSPDQ